MTTPPQFHSTCTGNCNQGRLCDCTPGTSTDPAQQRDAVRHAHIVGFLCGVAVGAFFAVGSIIVGALP